ncbi:uncharacterized protein LOC135693461 isoform X1 [Rhopilema esculentum]|uniref:uncharacterized protein LOC135693461 isoform X1 n=1 Tax=Rhopilema esculentum TaxID=499914 RepID=UPI0031E2206F
MYDVIEYKANLDSSGSDADNDEKGSSDPESPEKVGKAHRKRTRNAINIDENVPIQDEPKFIVFQSMLVALFSLFCFKCGEKKPALEDIKYETMVKVIQACKKCKGAFTWSSQPLVLGQIPAGNILLSFATLAAGASISKVLLILRHMGVCCYTARTLFKHQKKFLFPTILSYWDNYRENMLAALRPMKHLIWSGDGRFDSMGHNAKYGIYSMYCSSNSKIVHFELLQANEAGTSNAMELLGAKKCFERLQKENIDVSVFVSDRHTGIAKWIKDHQTRTRHFYDIWHVARSICRKIAQAAKEKGLGRLQHWIKGIRRHLYWCILSTRQGFGALIYAKWTSIMRHVADKHDGHDNPLFPKCKHQDLERRRWIKIDKLLGRLSFTAQPLAPKNVVLFICGIEMQAMSVTSDSCFFPCPKTE